MVPLFLHAPDVLDPERIRLLTRLLTRFTLSPTVCTACTAVYCVYLAHRSITKLNHLRDFYMGFNPIENCRDELSPKVRAFVKHYHDEVSATAKDEMKKKAEKEAAEAEEEKKLAEVC